MSPRPTQLLKSHYQQLRTLSCEQLWKTEVPRFNAAPQNQRAPLVSIVRAVGVVFSESGSPEQKAQARDWMRELLSDPEEKVRRYAILALPKLEASRTEEHSLLHLLKESGSARERRVLTTALERVGGKATLQARRDETLNSGTLLRLKANIARGETPSSLRFEKTVALPHDTLLRLRCRKGIQEILREEVQQSPGLRSKFRVSAVLPEQVCVVSKAPFSLEQLYSLRTFSSVGVVLGEVPGSADQPPVEPLAALIAAPLCEQILRSLTSGPLRYRFELGFKTSRGRFVKPLAERVFELNPRLLNDPRNAPWEIQILRTTAGFSVELSPRLRPDPRFAYRQGDVPAASHPPLAATLARIAGVSENETVWDPFCGSGLELIERCLLGGVSRVFGTDLAPEAIETARANLRAALPSPPETSLLCIDFRKHTKIPTLRNVSLILTNPPLGKRVPIPNLSKLIEDLFEAAAATLRPGGRLVLVNPLPLKPKGDALRLVQRQKVDLGCFFCCIEKYERVATPPNPAPRDVKASPKGSPRALPNHPAQPRAEDAPRRPVRGARSGPKPPSFRKRSP
ncbi:MAG: hypothetical protein RLZZ142_1240 [Verrucomicrobiota bacterium]